MTFFALFEAQNQPERKAVRGSQGVAEEQLAPTGYIRVSDELWKVEVISGGVIEKGEAARIRGIRGLILLVEPEDDGVVRLSTRLPARLGGIRPGIQPLSGLRRGTVIL